MSKYLVAKKFFENKRPSGKLYDAEIEYLETIGSQCIDTELNIQSTDNLRIVFDFQFLTRKTNGKYQYIFSTATTNNWLSFEVDINSPYHAYTNVGSTTLIPWTRTTIPYNQWIQCDYNINAQNKTINITGWQNINSSYSGSHGTGTFYICSLNNSTYVDSGIIAKFKPMQIYINDALVRDLIPVRVGNVGYMYDKVSGKLFGNSGTGNFVLGPDIRYPEIEEPDETISTKFIVGKHYSNNISQSNQFSVIKKQFKTKFNIEFDSQGGTSHEQKYVILGETYGELPVPTKSQNIFIGWFTDPTSGSQITEDSVVEINVTKLYARWEYVQIDSDCTSYSVTTTSSYRNTGIYAASISNSSQSIYIDWGDGTVEKTNSSISQKSHTYKTNGNFIVKISNNITSFAPSYNNSTWYGTTSQNRYTFKGMLKTGGKVTSLPTHAFYYCSAMTNIDFMETCWTTITSLPNYCFCYCTGLTSIQGVTRYTSLGAYCFQYCTGLSGVQDLSNFKFTSLTNSYVFANCSNVKRWILPTIFNGTTFGSYMFYNNTQLSGFGQELSETITQNIVEIEYLESTGTQWIDTETNVGQNTFNIDFKAQFSVDENNALYLIGIGTSTSYTGTGIAFGTHNNKWSVIFPGITYNEFGTYTNNTVSFNFNVDFNACHISGYDTATFNNTGNSLTNSAQWRNDQCTIHIFKVTDQTIPSSGKIYTCKIYIGNNFVRDLIPVRVGNTGYMYDKISGQLFGNQGTGNFILGPDKENGFQTQIEQQIFSNALPNTLTSVGSYCFQNCSNLKNLIVPSKIQSIGNYAFYGCTSLNNVSIESTNLTAINQYAFYNCNKLADLDLPDTVKTIGNYAFYSCTSLNYAGKQNTEFPSQLTSIGSYAYQGCINLKQLNIPENLQTIGDYAFAGCYQISSIVDKRLVAQTVSTNTFGSATGTSNTAFIGYQTRGNNILSTYFAATGYDENAWVDPLQNPDKCGFVQQYIDPENIVRCTVTFDAGIGNVSETTRSIIKGKKIGELPIPRCPVDTPYFGGWFTNINGTGTKVSKDYRITTDITFHALYSTVPFTVCNIDLNNQWRASSKANPDSSLYDGPYESNSNYNIGNAYSKMYIRISGYSTFNVYIRSYAESSYDYAVAMNLDVDVTSNPSSGTLNVKAHTSGKQNSGTAIGNYTKVEYTDIPDGEHFICIVYRKDGSVNDGDDRGYVLIDKQDVASTDSRSIFLVDDVGILYDEDKQLMIASERIKN